ncbi:MAG: glycosyltransferase family 2 protein [Verrucomicrobia bacterium]|nr:glycosyltransferase family 2 protein [Verrucomicrobiota bacterium]
MFNQTLINALFVLSVVVIWFMLAYQFVLCLLGWLHGIRSERERQQLEARPLDLPGVSVLIPAHNEAVVLEHTLAAMAALNYPKGRLEVIVINDASTDDTGAIAERWAARDPRLRVVHLSAAERAGGKSAALNRGLRHARFEAIAVYDADNTPEPEALRHLARQLTAHPELGAVIGTFRCANRRRNLLTRLINIEGLSYQWTVQAGRWMLLRICSLPGTNLILRRSVIEAIGGWDTHALTEDAEMSIRIYEAGYQIKLVPYAVTWEQEPERLPTWFRQRTRWARGNNYLVAKHVPRLLSIRPRRLGIELLYALGMYYVCFAAIALSDLLFLLCGLQLAGMTVPGPFWEVWLLALGLFVAEVMLALSHARGEDSLANLFLSALAYFTYCQLWIPVVVKALFDDYILRKARTWAKTERFAVTPPLRACTAPRS